MKSHRLPVIFTIGVKYEQADNEDLSVKYKRAYPRGQSLV